MNTPSSNHVKYDDLEWHVGGDYPQDLGPEGGRTHMGMYLAWLVSRRLLSDELVAQYPNEVRQSRDHMIKGSQLLQICCQDVLVRDDMSPQGQAFSDFYYDQFYLDDYVETLDNADLPSIYHVPDDWESYEALYPVLEERYAAWLHAQAQDTLDE